MSALQPQDGNRLFQTKRVCPWWLCFTFDNALRRLLQNPERMLKPYIMSGWTVLDIGPGMGYFTIPLANLTGDSGKVIAADLQKEMLDGVYRRALKAGVQDRVKLHLSTRDSIGINETIDFCLAFWMVHEVPEPARFFREISSCLKPGGLLLLAEPRFHVSRKSFTATVETARAAGLSLVSQPKIFLSYSALLRKQLLMVEPSAVTQ